MTINGWHRLWMLVSALWGIAAVGLCLTIWMDVQQFDAGDLIRTALVLWLVPSVLLLGLGHGLAWAIRGFRGTGSPR